MKIVAQSFAPTALFCGKCGAKCGEQRKNMSFQEFQSITSLKRKDSSNSSNSNSSSSSRFKSKKNTDKRFTDESIITIKEMLCKDGKLNPRSGFSIPLQVKVDADALHVKRAAYEKMSRYCPDFSCSDISDCKLVYESGEVVRYIPGTCDPFTLRKFKADSGLSYSRIILYLQVYENFKDLEDIGDFNDLDLPPAPLRYFLGKDFLIFNFNISCVHPVNVPKNMSPSRFCDCNYSSK